MSGVEVVHIPDLDGPRKAFTAATRESARIAGRVAKREIRTFIPRYIGDARGGFTGESAQGNLWSAVVAQEPRQRTRDWVVRVGVKSTRLARIYARIHNYGGTIVPRVKPYLVFQLPNGQWIRTKRVRIRRKLYFTRGWQNAGWKLQNVLGNEFRNELHKEIRYR